MSAISFRLSCVPPKTTAQTLRLHTVGGKPRTHKNKKVAQAQRTLAVLLTPFKPDQPVEGPIELTVVFTWPWRKSEPQKNRKLGEMWMPVRPDLDNLSKVILDTMTKVGFWGDDAQIVSLTMEKKWGDSPGIEITVVPLT